MIEYELKEFLKSNNLISTDEAIRDDLVGLRIFDTPLIGYADAKDEWFSRFETDENIVYKKFIHPCKWMPEARTIISIFFPYSGAIKVGNSVDMRYPSDEWLHARYEGQRIIDKCTSYLLKVLRKKGFNAIAPSLDKKFEVSIGTYEKTIDISNNKNFYSNWSERHVAYVAGLGTFGLSKGLITKKGVTGRFTSIITDYYYRASIRDYSGIYDYCTQCGKCILNCPVNAISMEMGKNHTICSRFVDYTGKKSDPRYGCGKCQVDVPCQNGIPYLDINELNT